MSSSKPNPKARQQALNAKYGSALPILLSMPRNAKGKSKSLLQTYAPSLAVEISVPRCTGVFDPITRSVWVTDRADIDILFRRGFFGKGTLSRSEASWRERRVDLLKGGSSYAAEQIREKRRLERKQFKIDRAAAMLDAAKTAEAVLVTGQAPPVPGSIAAEEKDMEEAEQADRPSSPTPSASTTTTATTAIDVSSLTPQTYLVRPTRPDTNRNRGRKAFKRKPPASTPAPAPAPAVADSNSTGATPAAATATASESTMPQPAAQEAEVDDEVDPIPEEDGLEEELIDELEHLQLSLEEAWFLSSALGVLRIFDPRTQAYLPPSAVLPLLLTPIASPTPTVRPKLRPDDPFLVSYIGYHHFRTLGWVVKPGIKFCADWLLYRRGPVFSHSAFAVVLVPVYEDEAEKAVSPYGNEDWYEERTSWKWMNTIMRVNSLVQKTVIIAYITIPSLSSFPASRRDGADGLRSTPNDMEDLLKRFTIREVVLSRFGPARRRD